MGLSRAARAVSGLAAAAAAFRPAMAVSGVLAVMVGRPRPVRRRTAIRSAAKAAAKPDMSGEAAIKASVAVALPSVVAATEAAIKASVAIALPPGWVFDIVTDREEELRCWRYTLYARPPGDKQEWACDAFVDYRAASQPGAREVAALPPAAPLPDYPDIVPAYGQMYYAAYPDPVPVTMCTFPDRVR